MDDAREWTATAPRRATDAPATIQPGDPWGSPLLGADAPEPGRHDLEALLHERPFGREERVAEHQRGKPGGERADDCPPPDRHPP